MSEPKPETWDAARKFLERNGSEAWEFEIRALALFVEEQEIELEASVAAGLQAAATWEREAKESEARLARVDRLLEMAWGLIANAGNGNGNWDAESPTWKIGAESWRDQYFASIQKPGPPPELEPQP